MPIMKIVLRLDLNCCSKCKKVALHFVTQIEGIDSLTIDIKESTLTVIGDVDPVCICNLLRKKFRCAQLVSYAPLPPPPSKEKPEKKPDPPPPTKPKCEKCGMEFEPPKCCLACKAKCKACCECCKCKAPKPPCEAKCKCKAPKPPCEARCKPPKAPCEAQCKGKCNPPCSVCICILVNCCPQSCGCSCKPVDCYPPCCACSTGSQLLWPRYRNPCVPDEICYVLDDGRQGPCGIM